MGQYGRYGTVLNGSLWPLLDNFKDAKWAVIAVTWPEGRPWQGVGRTRGLEATECF